MILNKGETLFLQEEQGDMYCLKRGLLKVIRTRENGEVFLFNLLVPGDIFPHHSLFVAPALLRFCPGAH
jgi:CRP/FNR family transcriptional regulator, cyclic AMP receptor protein